MLPISCIIIAFVIIMIAMQENNFVRYSQNIFLVMGVFPTLVHFFNISREVPSLIFRRDGCGILVKTIEKDYVIHNAVSCGHDSCLVHLQTLKLYSNISNVDDWKQQTFYSYGKKLGGKTCHLLWQYGLASLVPILLNLIFNMIVFIEDVKSGKAYMLELITVLPCFYPQWKTIRFLVEYCFHRNEEQLYEAKDKFDQRLGSLESFLESAAQVSPTCSSFLLSILQLFRTKFKYFQ